MLLPAIKRHARDSRERQVHYGFQPLRVKTGSFLAMAHILACTNARAGFPAIGNGNMIASLRAHLGLRTGGRTSCPPAPSLLGIV